MGYIHDFEERLDKLLAGVDEATRAAVVKLAKETVLESFKNGITAAKMTDANKEAEGRARRFAKGHEK